MLVVRRLSQEQLQSVSDEQRTTMNSLFPFGPQPYVQHTYAYIYSIQWSAFVRDHDCPVNREFWLDSIDSLLSLPKQPTLGQGAPSTFRKNCPSKQEITALMFLVPSREIVQQEAHTTQIFSGMITALSPILLHSEICWSGLEIALYLCECRIG